MRMRWPRSARKSRRAGVPGAAEGALVMNGVVHSMKKPCAVLAALACTASVLLGACSSADDDLQGFITEVKHEGGGRVEPLPEVKPYQAFIYAATSLRSPFVPSAPS